MIERYLLDIAIIANLTGFAAFITIYLFTASPLKHYMGKRIFIFMSLILAAFAYVIIARLMRDTIGMTWLIRGWILVLGLLATGVWWATAILIKYQLAARRERVEEIEK